MALEDDVSSDMVLLLFLGVFLVLFLTVATPSFLASDLGSVALGRKSSLRLTHSQPRILSANKYSFM